MLHEAVFEPSAVVAVIIAEPANNGVTTPMLLTVAAAVLVLAHEIFVFVAIAGVNAAVNVAAAPPAKRINVLALTLTPDTMVTEGETA